MCAGTAGNVVNRQSLPVWCSKVTVMSWRALEVSSLVTCRM